MQKYKENYQVKTIYFAHTCGGVGNCSLFPGWCADVDRGSILRISPDPREDRLWVPTDWKVPWYQKPTMTIYAASYEEDDGNGVYVDSPYFLTVEEVRDWFKVNKPEALETDGGWDFMWKETELSLNPMDTPDEFIVNIVKGSDGRLCTRIASQPRETGYTCRGKLFFPDKSWKGATEGKARVKITKEFDTYGFITGEMYTYRQPTLSEVLDWAWKHCEPDQDLTRIFRGDVKATKPSEFDGKSEWAIFCRDRRTQDFVQVLSWCVNDNEMNVEAVSHAELARQNYIILRDESLVVWQVSDRYNLTTGAAGRFINSFTESKYYSDYLAMRGPILDVQWERGRLNGTLSDILDKAVFKGWVEPIAFGDYKDVTIMTIDARGIMGATELSFSDFKQLVKEFNSWNVAMDTRISNLAKKGRIRLQNRRYAW